MKVSITGSSKRNKWNKWRTQFAACHPPKCRPLPEKGVIIDMKQLRKVYLFGDTDNF